MRTTIWLLIGGLVGRQICSGYVLEIIAFDQIVEAVNVGRQILTGFPLQTFGVVDEVVDVLLFSLKLVDDFLEDFRIVDRS